MLDYDVIVVWVLWFCVIVGVVFLFGNSGNGRGRWVRLRWWFCGWGRWWREEELDYS